MKRSIPLTLLVIPSLCANNVPASSEEQLLAKSDLVIVGRVVAIDLTPPAGASDRITQSEINIGTIVSRPCVSVAVERHIKGAGIGPIVICAHRVAELNPAPHQFGERYTMFLRRAGTVFVATSWDGIKDLPSS